MGSRRRGAARRRLCLAPGRDDSSCARQAAATAFDAAGCHSALHCAAGRCRRLRGGPASAGAQLWLPARAAEASGRQAAVAGALQTPGPAPCAARSPAHPSTGGPRKRRRRASGASLAALVTSGIITVDAAAPAALAGRRCPCGRPPEHFVHFRLDCGPAGGLAAVGTQVRCPAAASMRRGSQRGGAVYEKEREAKQKIRNGRPASTAADQSTRRGGWRPAGCGAAHEQRSGRRVRTRRRRSAPTWVVSDSGARRGPIGRRESAAWSGGTRRPFQCLAAGAFRIRFRNILRPSGPAALQQSSPRPRCWELVPIHDVQA